MKSAEITLRNVVMLLKYRKYWVLYLLSLWIILQFGAGSISEVIHKLEAGSTDH